MNITDYGYRAYTSQLPGIPARVTAVHRERYEIVCEYGMLHARLKAREYYMDGETFPTTGDFVAVQVVPDGDSLIVATLPRRTLFIRCLPMRQRKAFPFG